MFFINNIKKESVALLSLMMLLTCTVIHSSSDDNPKHIPRHGHKKSQKIRGALFETDGFNERFQKAFLNNNGKEPQRNALHMMSEDLSLLKKVLHKKKHMLHAEKRQITLCLQEESPFSKYGNCNKGIEELRLLKAHKKALAQQSTFVSALRDALTEKESVSELIKSVSQNKSSIQEIPATVEKVYRFGRAIDQMYGDDNFTLNTDDVFTSKTLHAMKQDIESSIERVMPLLKKQ